MILLELFLLSLLGGLLVFEHAQVEHPLLVFLVSARHFVDGIVEFCPDQRLVLPESFVHTHVLLDL